MYNRSCAAGLKATGSQSITNLRYDFANFPIFCNSC